MKSKSIFVVANWKMNPETPREAKALAGQVKRMSGGLTKVKTIICPPNIYLPLLVPPRPSKKLFWGVQDGEVENKGSYTGGVSLAMGRNSGASYCIVGHAERRAKGETDKIIREKIQTALRLGLKPIVCIGEDKRDNHGEYLEVLRRQIGNCLGDLKKNYYADIMIAYEPVWAIGGGAGLADNPENFLHNALFIRKIFASMAGNETALSLPVLYGGSVNPKNAQDFIKEGRADGLLVGRESLVPEHFKQILQIADKTK
ncbi:MAG: Triosephosphate isomerase [Patescibacteria group bacterium]|nr:Triosephosphate isomerase [Patescibacteria group bacterium]